MISNLEKNLSITGKNLKRSAIRELLKLTQKPELISFAGGLPAPDTFPIETLKDIVNEVLDQDGSSALQYGTTEGDPGLVAQLVKRYRKMGLDISSDNILVTTASQQALDLIPKIFIDRGDKIICGLPSYLGGLGAFKTYGADLVGIEFDNKGMRSDLLDSTIKDLISKNQKPKFIYVIPDFQNPAGITMPEDRRKEIIDIAHKYDILIIEDSPYRELRFEGEHQRTMYDLDGTGQVVTLGTFSKIFVPGFRVGWVIADEAIIDKLVMAKQNTDLCTAAFVQKIAAKYMEKGFFEENLKEIIRKYREKKEIMMDCLEKFMPKGVTWTKPEGGLFLFITLPKELDAEDLFQIAIKKNVAFVLGSLFHCNGEGKNTIRINFSFMPKEKVPVGIERLADATKELMTTKGML